MDSKEGQVKFSATGFVEFEESDLPPLLGQSGRAGARLNAKEQYLAVNKDFSQLMQTIGPVFHGSTLADLWEPYTLSRIQSGLIKSVHAGPQMVRSCALRSDPLRRLFDILFVSESEDTILQLLFSAVDAAEPQDTQDELRRLRAVIDLAPVLISIKDRHGIIRLTNRMFGILNGPEPEEYVNRSVFELFPPEIAAQLWKNDLAVISSGQMVEAEETVMHRDGSEHIYLTYKYPLLKKDGEVLEVCAISTDITARKYYEGKALEAMRKAEEANRVKSDFLAHMSHEIRTPLTVIRGYADIMARKTEADAGMMRPWISSVMRASKQLELIVNDILDLSKVEAGITEIAKSPVDLRLVLQELQQSFVLKALEKNLNLVVEVRDSVPALIKTDALRLRQVLDNLVSNALKFTEEGSVAITVETAAQSEQLLHIWVRDTGIGLSEDEQKKLFQPFVQADDSITRKYGGTGLGLVLARRLAQLLGGDVRIHRSAPQCGTDMLVIIATDDAREDASLIPAVVFSGGGLDPDQRLRGRSLLVVEDAPDIRELLRYFLLQHGAHVETASSGQDALACMKRRAFDGVLMDLQMPILDGMQTMKALRASGFEGVVMAVTAHALQGEREKCLQAGFDEFVTKPLQMPEVIEIIGNIIASKKAGLIPINSCHEP
ncbi:MAG TPA: ATP-binding protein [Oligoflexus sp.]|uniref:PAS domain-containing hybrid sensor histidine kinase/response regulator n=1 Tax=Oligoflexus sp. TaxID=1971216 RepID=UPI002D7E583C|nr:ATP-binding protein [Oligoflexus sp.]HET9240030.1 ATP-binding protein [Oligoflexus sp.]